MKSPALGDFADQILYCSPAHWDAHLDRNCCGGADDGHRRYERTAEIALSENGRLCVRCALVESLPALFATPGTHRYSVIQKPTQDNGVRNDDDILKHLADIAAYEHLTALGAQWDPKPGRDFELILSPPAVRVSVPYTCHQIPYVNEREPPTEAATAVVLTMLTDGLRLPWTTYWDIAHRATA